MYPSPALVELTIAALRLLLVVRYAVSPLAKVLPNKK